MPKQMELDLIDEHDSTCTQCDRRDPRYWECSYYVPRSKYELVQWFKKNRPQWSTKSWPKAQLYAVYHKTMKEAMGGR